MKKSLFVLALLSLPLSAQAQTFICASNPDYFSRRCTVHPYAITKVVNGVVEKGHLVGCQFKTYSCMKHDGRYQCRDNYGAAAISFDFSMNDLKSFCSLLCNNPACVHPQGPNSGWQ